MMTIVAIIVSVLFITYLGILFLISAEPRCKKCNGRLSYWGHCRYFCDECGEEDK